MGSATTLFHLAGALKRAAGRVFLTFILVLIIVAAICEAVLYFAVHDFTLAGHILSAALGIGWAFAISLFVLVFEVVKGLVAGVRDTAKTVEHQLGDAGKIVGGVVESVEHKVDNR